MWESQTYPPVFVPFADGDSLTIANPSGYSVHFTARITGLGQAVSVIHDLRVVG